MKIDKKNLTYIIAGIALIAYMVTITAAFATCVQNMRQENDSLISNNNLLYLEKKEQEEQIQSLKLQIGYLKGKINTMENLEVSGAEKQIDVSEKIVEEINPMERLPEGPTDFFAMMDYRMLSNQNEQQYALQQECYTDPVTGIRIFEKDGKRYYCAALASAYGRVAGEAWEVTLDNGTVFNIIWADSKDDGKDPDRFGDPCTNYNEQPCTNVIEFVIDEQVTPLEVRLYGSMSKYEWCNGKIIKMKHLGNMWR